MSIISKPSRIKLIILFLSVASSPSFAINVAVIHRDSNDPNDVNQSCNVFEQNGYTCSAFPTSGPTGSLDPFDVVINFSNSWPDPDGLLADHMRKGRGVITYGDAPHALGIDTNTTVQAWIGANSFIGMGDYLVTTATDAILGNTPIGMAVGFCGDSFCPGLIDTSGHPDTKVLVNFAEIDFTPFEEIAMLRNRWEGGQSVYISDGVEDFNFILRAVEILGNPIPTVSTWGLVVMTLTMLIAGSVVIRKRCAA